MVGIEHDTPTFRCPLRGLDRLCSQQPYVLLLGGGARISRSVGGYRRWPLRSLSKRGFRNRFPRSRRSFPNRPPLPAWECENTSGLLQCWLSEDVHHVRLWASTTAAVALSQKPGQPISNRTTFRDRHPPGHKTGDFLKLSTNSCFTGYKAYPCLTPTTGTQRDIFFSATRMLYTTFGGPGAFFFTGDDG
ncbi:hypothetical protein NPIL_255481 [Nephila pilipes]|uniref:Uncharacterized protein n=1 Tax=Nephila pilipes TaxID=299642 RepID=A0A8X6MKP0_NEPPI|nr:hypothetical protein NPIL_255481 [Nephila pilipes]